MTTVHLFLRKKEDYLCKKLQACLLVYKSKRICTNENNGNEGAIEVCMFT